MIQDTARDHHFHVIQKIQMVLDRVHELELVVAHGSSLPPEDLGHLSGLVNGYWIVVDAENVLRSSAGPFGSVFVARYFPFFASVGASSLLSVNDSIAEGTP